MQWLQAKGSISCCEDSTFQLSLAILAIRVIIAKISTLN